MPKNLPFLEKLFKRFDRVDKESLQSYVLGLAAEKERLATILDEIKEGALVLDAQGRLLWINAPASNWLGLKLQSKSNARVFEQLPDEAFAYLLHTQLKNLRDRQAQDFHLVTPREKYLRLYFIPLEKSPEKQILVLLVDRTEEKSQEISVDRLARIEALVSLAAGIAHEIGNPLNSLSIHLQLLKKEIKDLPPAKRQPIEKSLNIMTSEAARLDRIIKNFLKASRKPPIKLRVQDLNRIIENAVAFLQPEARENDVEISVRLDRKLEPFLMDDDRLYQAFMNLIKNAIEAMPRGGLLKIYITHKESLALVRFEDQGSGIREEDLPHIFDAYYTTKEEGSGLGLMTVFNTVSEHGGRIDVASKVGKGTTFSIFLPIRKPKLQLPKYDLSSKK